jgi:hypothetical protein
LKPAPRFKCNAGGGNAPNDEGNSSDGKIEVLNATRCKMGGGARERDRESASSEWLMDGAMGSTEVEVGRRGRMCL